MKNWGSCFLSSRHWPCPESTHQKLVCKRVPGGAWTIKRDADKAPQEGHRQGRRGTNVWIAKHPPSDLLTPTIQGAGEPNTAVPKSQRRWQSREDILEGQAEDNCSVTFLLL